MKQIQKKNLFPYKEFNKRYHTLDYFYKTKFNQKIVKVSLNAGFTCPNIDGTVGTGGCIYCSNLGSGDFAGDQNDDLITQFNQVRNVMDQKWPNSLYIGYFQAHTNTYAPISILKQKYETILSLNNVIGLAIATRPDAITEECLDYLEQLSKKTYLTIELGLQSIHKETSKFINRCHSLECLEKMVLELRKRNIDVVVHIMNGLPYETKEMMLETIKYVNTLDIQGIKIHMLHILTNTKLALIYQSKPFPVLTKEEYVDIVCDQLELLRPEIVIHRITGDPKKEDLIAPNWLLKKFDVLNCIDKELARRNTYQGFNLSIKHFRKKKFLELLHHHDHIYSFDTSKETLDFFNQITSNGKVYCPDEIALKDLNKETLNFIYCNKIDKNDIPLFLSHLHNKGVILIESKLELSYLKEFETKEQFLNTFFYTIKKN